MIFLAICHKVNDISSCFQVPNQCITAINLKYLLHYSLQKHFFLSDSPGVLLISD
jgi:hypothetical protein